MSAPRETIIRLSRTVAVGRQVLLDLSQPFAAAVVTAFVASVFATAVTLAKSGANCANVMISTVCATKENCAQDMASVTVASASAIQTGKEKTVTAPGGLIPACLTWVCCAVAEASVCVGPVSAPSQALMGPRVTSVPPAPMPAL